MEGRTLDTCQSTVTSRQHGPRVSHSTLFGSPGRFYSDTYLYNSNVQLDIQYTHLTCQLHAWHSQQLAWVRSCPIRSLHNAQAAPFAAIPTLDSPQAAINHLKRPVAVYNPHPAGHCSSIAQSPLHTAAQHNSMPHLWLHTHCCTRY